MTIKLLLLVFALCVGATGAQSPRKRSRIGAPARVDLAKIEHIAPKGRVQDTDYNNLEVVDQLIAKGTNSIPYLISKLDDKTIIHKPLEDFWPELTVGDVAFLILCDFSLDSTWTKETIPGASFDDFFGTKNREQAASEYYYGQLKKHGRTWVKAKWRKIWMTYRDRIVWDEKERCFRVV